MFIKWATQLLVYFFFCFLDARKPKITFKARLQCFFGGVTMGYVSVNVEKKSKAVVRPLFSRPVGDRAVLLCVQECVFLFVEGGSYPEKYCSCWSKGNAKQHPPYLWKDFFFNLPFFPLLFVVVFFVCERNLVDCLWKALSKITLNILPLCRTIEGNVVMITKNWWGVIFVYEQNAKSDCSKHGAVLHVSLTGFNVSPAFHLAFRLHDLKITTFNVIIYLLSIPYLPFPPVVSTSVRHKTPQKFN